MSEPLDEAEAIRNEVPAERQLTGTHRLLRFAVGRNHGKGWRLDRYLHALMPTLSRSMIQRWVERGCATVDGEVAIPALKLKPGQLVVLTAPLPERDESAPQAQPLAILYHDRWLLVANKPPGQLAHQAGRTMTGTLLNQAQDWLEARGGDPQQARLVNRIDRDTSGIVLVSLDEAAHVRLAAAMEARDLHKEYRALCHGAPQPAAGSWRDPIGEGPPESIARVVRPDGQECHTEYEVLETTGPVSGVRCPVSRRHDADASGPASNRSTPSTGDPVLPDTGHRTPDTGLPGPGFSLLRLLLHTGRQHQIRVHAAHNGHPLVGDWVYGSPCAELPGQALHAAVMEFPHPVEKRTVRVEAPFPALLAALWDRLRSGGALTPMALSDEQRSKLGIVSPRERLRRPKWLSEAEFLALRHEAGE